MTDSSKPHAVVSTVDGWHFVRVFVNYDAAFAWLAEWLHDEFDEKITNSNELEDFILELAVTEWLLIEPLQFDGCKLSEQ